MQTDRVQPGASTSSALPAMFAAAVRPLLPATHYAVVFGSRATGRAGHRSDWDIGIVGATALDGAVIERVREALEALPTLATFEVVDLATVPTVFRERALREGVRL